MNKTIPSRLRSPGNPFLKKMIKNCRSCRSNQLIPVVSLGRQYLSDFRSDNTLPDQYNLDVLLCTNCTLVQLKETTPPDKMYNDNYGYKSGINNTIKADLLDIVTKALILKPTAKTVLDIGANDGTLLSFYPKDIHRVGVEPVRKLAEEARQHANLIINDFFNGDLLPIKADIITVISCFYDLEDPNKFVTDLVNSLAPDGLLVIEQNYLVRMLDNNAFDNIVHEHLEFYSLTSLEHLLNKHGLEVFDVEENSINGGAFRVYVKHMNNVSKMRIFEQRRKLNNKFTYMMFEMKIRDAKKKTHDFIKKQVGRGKTVYLYGASTRGNTLIQYLDLDNKLIKAAVERNPEKWGKKISSLQIPIISEEQARLEKPDYMLVLPWFFKEEFLVREKEYLDQGGHFIFPLPEFKVV